MENFIYYAIRASDGTYINDTLYSSEKAAASFRNEFARDAHIEPLTIEEANDIGEWEIQD